MKRIFFWLFDNNVYLWAKIGFTTFFDTIGITKKSAKYSREFEQVKTFCLFIGYPRSGHSLVGSIIDAHPNGLMAHRLDSVKYLEKGYSLKEIFYLILKNSRRFANSSRQLTSYAYSIQDGWHGKFQELRVIGDQEANWSSQRLGQNPALLRRLLSTPAVQLKFIHVTRNPFDNITTWALRTGDTLPSRIAKYFSLADNVEKIKSYLNANQLLEIRHEEFLLNPTKSIQEVCQFLDLDASEAFIKNCQAIFYGSPKITRHAMEWSPELIRLVEDRMREFSFLTGYSYDTKALNRS